MGRTLLEETHAELPLTRNDAGIRLERALEHAEQSGLAAAVPADEADALRRFDGEPDALEQGRLAESLGYAVDGDEIHVDATIPRGEPALQLSP